MEILQNMTFLRVSELKICMELENVETTWHFMEYVVLKSCVSS